MKRVIQFVSVVLPQIRLTIFLVGLIFMFLLMTLSRVYLQGGEIGEAKMDFVPLVTGGGGFFPYVWVGFFFVWLGLEMVYWGNRVRNLWVHRNTIKRDMVREGQQLKKLWSKIRGET